MTEAAAGSDRDERARATFGPFDALRAVTDLQAQGIRAASDVASRLTGLLDHEAPPPRTAAGDLRAAVGRLVDVYGDVLERTVDVVVDLIEERSPRPGGPTRIEVALATGSGSGELWVGNDTDAPAGPLRLVVGPLVSADGAALAGRVELTPAVVDALAPGASVRVAVSAAVEPGARPGYYHGYVLVPELPGEALPVTLVVT